MNPFRSLLTLSVLAVPLAAQDMIGVTWTGEVWGVDSATGAGTRIGSTGFSAGNQTGHNGMTIDGAGDVLASFTTVNSTQLLRIDTTTGAGTAVGPAVPIDVRGLAYGNGTLYAVADTSGNDVLHSLDPINGTATPIGTGTGFGSIQGLCFGGGTLYAWDLREGLLTVDTSTGNATDVNPNVVGPSGQQFLTPVPGGGLIVGRNALSHVDPVTGTTTLIGGSGYRDLRGCDFLDAGVPYGQGCPGTNGVVPVLAGNRPGSPGTLTATVTDGLPNAPCAYALGVGRGSLPLPGGCTLLLQLPIDTLGVQLDANGSHTLSGPVPAGLSGNTFALQAVILDAGAPSGMLSATQGVEIVVR